MCRFVWSIHHSRIIIGTISESEPCLRHGAVITLVCQIPDRTSVLRHYNDQVLQLSPLSHLKSYVTSLTTSFSHPPCNNFKGSFISFHFIDHISITAIINYYYYYYYYYNISLLSNRRNFVSLFWITCWMFWTCPTSTSLTTIGKN